MKELIEYLLHNKIKFSEIDESFIQINDERYFLVQPDEENLLFSEKFILMSVEQDCTKYVYCFGGHWYWENRDDYDHPKLNELKYIGTVHSEIITESFLGVRGEREPLNGSRLYKDWCKKAKFLQCKTLGICEKNTLAGTLKFQLACQNNDIKSIIGATYTVFREKEDFRYDVKIYVRDEQGWDTLLLINKEVKVVNRNFITEERLLELLDGVFLIIDPKSLQYSKISRVMRSKIDFYQLDPVEYSNNDRDTEYLENLKLYVRSDLKPISITDAFYLDAENSYIKKTLNAISGVREYESDNQYFKDKEDYFDELSPLFSAEDDSLFDIFDSAVKNEKFVTDHCNYKIVVGQKFIPKYQMTEEEEKKYGTNENLFYSLIEDGLREKVEAADYTEYLARIDYESDVISRGGFIDYFLILWDIIKWCETKKILTGVGRGSAAGCLISYLMNITRIDPLPYKLLFERFLNEGRIGKIVDCEEIVFEGEGGQIVTAWFDKYLPIRRDGKLINLKASEVRANDILV